MTDTLGPGQSLAVGGQLTSANGDFKVVYHADGMLHIYNRAGTLLARIGQQGPGIRCIMEENGNLISCSRQRPPPRVEVPCIVIWASNTDDNPDSRLVLLDDGSLVILDPGNREIWRANIPKYPSAQGDDMQPGEVLYPDQSIRSANGRFSLIYQRDGNLVLYGPAGWLWQSGTAGTPGAICIMQGDGNLVIYDWNNQWIWDSETDHNPGSRLLVQDNGMVAIYDPSNKLVWSTNVLQIPFRFGAHNLTFKNFKDGLPDWSTYEETFGAAEVWHELLDPVFGHPVLTAAFYLFYHYFLKGEPNGGLATGFCTALASLVADNFWQGKTDTPTITEASVKKKMTAVHGKLLSRESLIHFHDQGREGIARVEKTYREIEATFLHGVNRHNAPLLFFIPSGAIWDSGYIDKLGETHCVMPYRFVYPTSHSGPRLSADGSTTTTDPDRVEMYVWDTNKPTSTYCKLVFRRVGERIEYEYFPDLTTPQFTSQHGITLGMMTNGHYMLSDHDLPFSGPAGVQRFVIDFLLSPAELQIRDAKGLRTGNFGAKIYSEIPGSHPCYLVKGAYLLPEHTALTRKIVGRGAGRYDYNSIMPDGTTVAISGVSTATGQKDILSISSDATKIRFAPAVKKTFSITLARKVGDQMRAVAITGAGAGPGKNIDITVSPEMSALRMANRATARRVNVKAFAIAKSTNTPANKEITGVSIPADHDLAVTFTDWGARDLQAQVYVRPRRNTRTRPNTRRRQYKRRR